MKAKLDKNKMNLKSIKLALMKKQSDINKENKAIYDSYASCTFNIPDDFFENDNFEELCESLLEALYNDLMNAVEHDVKDHLGMWISCENKIYENAISLQTLDDMKNCGAEHLSSIYEFFK